MAIYKKKFNATDEKIKTIVQELLIKKSIHQVTVDDICENANVNRSTFYRHFTDKYAVLEQMERDFIDKINQIPRSNIEKSKTVAEIAKNLDQFVSLMLAIIKNEQPVLQVLFSNHSDSNFQNSLKQYLVKKIKESWGQLEFEHTNDFDIDLAMEFIATAEVSIIQYTINNPGISDDIIRQTLASLLINGPLKTLFSNFI